MRLVAPRRGKSMARRRWTTSSTRSSRQIRAHRHMTGRRRLEEDGSGLLCSECRPVLPVAAATGSGLLPRCLALPSLRRRRIRSLPLGSASLPNGPATAWPSLARIRLALTLHARSSPPAGPPGPLQPLGFLRLGFFIAQPRPTQAPDLPPEPSPSSHQPYPPSASSQPWRSIGGRRRGHNLCIFGLVVGVGGEELCWCFAGGLTHEDIYSIGDGWRVQWFNGSVGYWMLLMMRRGV